MLKWQTVLVIYIYPNINISFSMVFIYKYKETDITHAPKIGTLGMDISWKLMLPQLPRRKRSWSLRDDLCI